MHQVSVNGFQDAQLHCLAGERLSVLHGHYYWIFCAGVLLYVLALQRQASSYPAKYTSDLLFPPF
jgi:hypothetical protein